LDFSIKEFWKIQYTPIKIPNIKLKNIYYYKYKKKYKNTITHTIIKIKKKKY
jgi:hypothetical protein